MARAISDEEQQLKRRARRRLIGAIVLVTAIVVALPMLLDTEPRPLGGEVSIKIPPPEKYLSRVVPLPPSAEPRPAPPDRAQEPDGKAAPKFAAALGEKAGPDTAPAPPERKAPPPVPPQRQPAQPDAAAPEGAAAAPPATGSFAVQVIALSDVEKVKEVREKIAAAGLDSYTEVVHTARGEVTRVRAGPYPTRAAAESAREKLQAAGLSGNIVTK